LADVFRIGRGIAGGLIVIHGRGLIHRDLKPANLWMEEPSGRVKILDFGLARFVHDDATLTQSGAILGTPCFMSPEQARGEPLDHRSDLFSFGCVLYNLCTGTIPFYASNTTAVLTALAVSDPSPVHDLNQAVPRALSDLVSQLLAKNPLDRPESAEEVLDRLRQIEEGRFMGVPPDTTPTHGPATVGEATEPPPTRLLPPAAGPAAEPGWGKFWLAVALIAGAAFVVPLVVTTAFRHGVLGAGHVEKGRRDLVYLKSLAPIHQENWPFIPPPRPGAPPGTVPGQVCVQGRISPNGIFMHPPPDDEGSANLTYHLAKEFESFHAEVSQNDGPPHSQSPYTFAVYGDGKLLWQSRPVSRQADQQNCAVSVRGVDNLRIEVRCTGEPRGAHAVWIEPFLTK
jgi:serine/threonine protein kinase